MYTVHALYSHQTSLHLPPKNLCSSLEQCTLACRCGASLNVSTMHVLYISTAALCCLCLCVVCSTSVSTVHGKMKGFMDALYVVSLVCVC